MSTANTSSLLAFEAVTSVPSVLDTRRTRAYIARRRSRPRRICLHDDRDIEAHSHNRQNPASDDADVYKSPRVPARTSLSASLLDQNAQVLVLLALSAATGAVVGVGAQGACARNATVQSPGETCDVISNLFNASTSVHPTPRHQIPCSGF